MSTPDETSWTPSDEAVEAMCEVMHNAYEAAATVEGWETQERSRKPWADVPIANKATMRVAVRALLTAAYPVMESDAEREVARLRTFIRSAPGVARAWDAEERAELAEAEHDAARAEVARLRESLKNAVVTTDGYAKLVDAQAWMEARDAALIRATAAEAEVARLRESLDHTRDYWHQARKQRDDRANDLTAARAEVARLAGAVERVEAVLTEVWHESQHDNTTIATAEIMEDVVERVRAAITPATDEREDSPPARRTVDQALEELDAATEAYRDALDAEGTE